MPERRLGNAHGEELIRECRLLTRYLVKGDPAVSVVDAYLEAHRHPPLVGRDPRLLDRWIFTLGRLAPLTLRAADAYSRFFDSAGLLRCKLTLVLALLEHAPPFHTSLNRGAGGGPGRAVLGLGLVGIGFAVSLAGGILVFGPAHVLRGSGPVAPSPSQPADGPIDE